jgi:ATP-dependent DNA helicase RecG
LKEQEKKLGAPLSTLSGVGPAIEKKLQNLNLYRVEDLLFLLPLRYEDRTCIIKLKDLIPGIRSLVTGEVLDAKIAFRGRRNLIVKISDGTEVLTLRFFYFSRKQYKQFETGTNVTCYGEIRRNKNTLEIIHPEYRILRPNQRPSVSKRLTPIYPTTMGILELIFYLHLGVD